MPQITNKISRNEFNVPLSSKHLNNTKDVNFREKELKEWEKHQRAIIREEYTK